MTASNFRLPKKIFQMQVAMLRVCYALIPIVVASVYLFGWRSFFLVITSLIFGILTEAVFNFKNNKSVTSAIFVTSIIFSLSLPPNLPFWMAIVGIIFGVAFGKMLFGGFGKNIFNPAMVGRCFIYVSFPIEMASAWSSPARGVFGGFNHWSFSVDAISMATPLSALRNGDAIFLEDLFWGNISGSIGETSAFLILLGGIYLIYKKAASWRLAGSCLLGGVFLSIILHAASPLKIASPIYMLLSGSFLFGTIFIVTEPISGPKSKPGQWIYGFMVGGLTITLRVFSNFPEGIMFSILIMNAFVPLLDKTMGQIKAMKKGKS
mgnify:CR=1 FL=1